MTKDSQEESKVLSPLEEDLLTILSSRKELYGLQIMNIINEANAKVGGDYRNITLGSLYPTLHKIKKRKLVDARWGDEEETGGGRRKYYSITEKGRQELEKTQTYRFCLATSNLVFS
jgi:PadR family transcriptional regulator PadR